MSARPFRSIATSLILKIYLWATAVALLVAVVQAAFSVQHVREEFEHELEEIAESSLPMLAVSLWDIEPQAIQNHLNRLVKRPQIGFVRLTAATGQVFVAGDAALLHGGGARRFAIPAPAATAGMVGEVEVATNPRALWRELRLTVGWSMLGSGLVTFLVCIMVALVLRRQLERPLRGIASFVSKLSPDNLTQPLHIDRTDDRPKDEIDLVVDGFGVLQKGIHDHIANLDTLVAERTKALEDALESIRHLSTIDPLTGLLNRRSFAEKIHQEMGRAERYGRPFSVIYCDIDHFKRINDTYGHAVGDEVLRSMGTVLQEGIRLEVDAVARFGGEEFVVLLPETLGKDASEVAERIRVAVLERVVAPSSPGLRITLSAGVATFRAGENEDQLIGRADQQLYLAKESGRNRTRADPVDVAASSAGITKN